MLSNNMYSFFIGIKWNNLLSQFKKTEFFSLLIYKICTLTNRLTSSILIKKEVDYARRICNTNKFIYYKCVIT